MALFEEDHEDDVEYCPHCGDFRPVDDEGICRRCDQSVDDDVSDNDGDVGERWCDVCGDYRPVDDDGCCMRCGEDTTA